MTRRIATLAGVAAGVELHKEPLVEQDKPSVVNPPTRLSIELKSPDYHPCYVRVGVKVDGIDRNDIAFYDTANNSYKTTDNTSHLAESIEPYWRYIESRQQRRARERWETKRGY